MTEAAGTPGLWVIHDDALREALEAASAGEPVDLILLGLYANSDIETYGEDE